MTERPRRGPRAKSAQRPSERARRADEPRRVAYTLLRDVAAGGYANLLLPTLLREAHLSGRDAAFATELAYGTLRMRGLYDPIIAVAAGRPLDKIDENVLDTLRLGAHQILGMRVPAHAALSETVALARQVNGAGAAGFVNAVLRRVAEREREDWVRLVAPADGGLAALAVRESHPEWVVKALRAALIANGAATADTGDAQVEELLIADNTPAEVALVARPGLAEISELVAAGAAASPLAATAARLDSGDPGRIPAVRDGRAAVQDEGSQLIALAMAQVPVDEAVTERWLDLCAGPGGKAGLLAAIAHQRGIPFAANEVSEHRADLVRNALRPLIAQGADISIRVGDGRTLDETDGQFSRVLIDAPCTGLGALRRRAESRWRREPSDVATLSGLQRELLVAGIEATEVGGVIGYATCSPHLNETKFVVGDVVKKRTDVEILDAREYFRDASGAMLPNLGAGPFAQLWPHIHDTDAMFFALLRKVSP